MNRPFSSPRGRRGFTLIEVIITMVVFVLLTASVFGIMSAVFQSSSTLKENQNRRDEVTAFQAYLKNTLARVGAADQLVTYQRGDGDGLHVNGILLVIQPTTMAIDAVRQPNGLYTIRLAKPAPDDDPNPNAGTFSQKLDRDTSALAWTTLLHDVKSVQWRFQADTPDWQDEWPNLGTKPGLVECTIQIAGDSQPTAMDFALPHLVRPGSQTLPATGGAHAL